MLLFLFVCGLTAAIAVLFARVYQRRRERALAEVYQRHFPPELMARLGQGGAAPVQDRGEAALVAPAGARLAGAAVLAAAPAAVVAPQPAAAAPVPASRAGAGGSALYLSAWHEREVRFVLLAVAAQSAEQASRRLGEACEVAVRYRWTVQALVCNVAVLVDGALAGSPPAAMSAEMLATELVGLLKTEAKAVHGACTAPVGDAGGRQRKAWGAMLPPFLDAMKALAELRYGTVGRQ
jgi:hypothetical protein